MSVARSSGLTARASARQVGYLARAARPARPATASKVSAPALAASASNTMIVLSAGQVAADLEDLAELRRRGAEDRHRAGVAQDVLDLVGRQGRVDRHVGAAAGQAGEVGHRPFRPVLGQDRQAVAGVDAEFVESDAERLHLGEQVREAEGHPGAAALDAHRDRAGGRAVHGSEEEFVEGAWCGTHKASESRPSWRSGRSSVAPSRAPVRCPGGAWRGSPRWRCRARSSR